MRPTQTSFLAILLVLLAVACGKSRTGDDDSRRVEAENFDRHECEACGMIVAEQSAPRGQVVHRDGTRHFFCSVSDMLTYLEAPSPHGAASHIFVEDSSEMTDPLAQDTAQRPWIAAEDATYVVGFEKPLVMGRPILTFRAPGKAQEVAAQLKAATTSWLELRAGSPREPTAP